MPISHCSYGCVLWPRDEVQSEEGEAAALLPSDGRPEGHTGEP